MWSGEGSTGVDLLDTLGVSTLSSWKRRRERSAMLLLGDEAIAIARRSTRGDATEHAFSSCEFDNC